MQGPVESTTAASMSTRSYRSPYERYRRLSLLVAAAFICCSAGLVYANQNPVDPSSKGFQPDAVVNQGPLPAVVIKDLIQAGKFEEAEAALNVLASADPNSSKAAALRNQLTVARQAAAEMSKAEGQATQAMALKGAEQKSRGDLSQGYVARGVKALAEKDYASSESYFQQALQVDPSNLNAQEGLKGVREAKASSSSVPSSQPTESASSLLIPESEKSKTSTIEDVALAQAADLFQKGFQAEKQGDFDSANEYYNQVLVLFPNSEDAKRSLLALEAKRAEEKIASGPPVQQKSVQNDPVLKAAPEYDAGIQAFKAGDIQSAKKSFQQVLSIIPDHSASQHYLEQCLEIEQSRANGGSSLADADSAGSLLSQAQSQFSSGDLSTAHETLSQIPSTSDDYETAQVYLNRIESQQSVTSPSVEKSTMLLAANEPSAVNDPWGGSSSGWQSQILSDDATGSTLVTEKSAGQPIRQSSLKEIAEESYVDDLPKPLQVAEADVVEEVLPEGLQPMVEAPLPAEVPAAPPVSTPQSPMESVEIPATLDGEVKELIEAGVRANEKGDILTAYELWEKAAQKDPNNPTAQAFLEKYAEENTEAQRNFTAQAQRTEVDDRVERLLNEKTYKFEQDVNVNISAFLSTMGTVADLQIITGEGVDGDIHALRTTEMTYRQVLDRVLKLNGYNWTRQPGTNIIEVTRDIIPKRFPLTEEQYQAMKRLAMDSMGGKETDDPSEALREVILGKVEPKEVDATIPGRKFFLSRQMMELVVIDSRHNVELIEQFISLYRSGNLQVEKKPLVVETFKLPKTGGENLARIINLRLFGKADFQSDFKDDEPYILYDDQTNILIIRQTPDKLELVKRLMRDSKFVEQVSERELKARKYTVVPAEDTRSETPDAQLRRRKQVEFTKNVFRTLLYGDRSIEEAAAEGRVMYPDPDAGTIDVVDTADNLRKIEEYLQGLTQNRYLTRVKMVMHRDVTELAYALQDMVLDVNINETTGRELSEEGTDTDTDTDRDQDSDSSSTNTQYGLFGIIRVIVTADIQTKRMIISGYEPSELDRAEDLIELLDVAVDQVEIEVRLVELTYDSADEFGITMAINNLLELDDNDEPGPGFTLADAAADFVSSPNGATGSSLTLATLGRTTIDATLNMLAQFSDIRILTAPKVTVVSGRQGNVVLGEQIPYVSGYTTTVVSGSDSPVVQSTVARATYGFTLNTMPFVTGDGHIELELQPDLTVPGDRLTIANPITGSLDAVGEPSAETRSAVVRVRVKDGSTLVMGGMLRRQVNHVEGRTPIFGFIPGLSSLFTEKSDTESTQNLLILVTARLIPEE